MLEFKHILAKLLAKENLHASESEFLMLEALRGNLSEAKTAAWLSASAAKGETPAEISAYAQAMRELGKRVILDPDTIDTCGTGGDQSNLINVSTLTAITLASLKIPVAKHGNHSVSSRCGSADILELLGYKMNEYPSEIKREIKNNYFTFLYAPYFHPAVRHVASVRKELGVRTIFNILGPLCNPSGANIQLMGVFSEKMLGIMSNTLIKLKTKCTLVFFSNDHLDEISPIEKTKYHLVHNSQMIEGEIFPPSGITIDSLDKLRAASQEEALLMAQETLRGTFIPGIEIVALNTAAGVFLWELNKKTVAPKDIQAYINEKYYELKKHIQKKRLLTVIKSWKAK